MCWAIAIPDLAITTGSGDWKEAAKEYGEIIKTFPDSLVDTSKSPVST